MLEIVAAVAERLRRYQAVEIPTAIAERDAMYARGVAGADEHYFSVGRSAIGVIAQGMIASGRTTFASALDLPCGAGRVTRHLRAFLPEAEIFASDLDAAGEKFAAKHFGATQFPAPRDFQGTPARTFDLVFVGSLLTHFDEAELRRALAWFAAALAPDGVLVITMHGRRAEVIERTRNRFLDPARYAQAAARAAASGFGFLETERICGTAYGVSLCRPSWLVAALEELPGTRIIALYEGAWDDHQDVAVLQRRLLG
jgi:SAM-dependent methyltransferase